MVKRVLSNFLIKAIEGLNNAIAYFQHDVKHGNSRKSVAVAIVLVAIMGLSFAGTTITGQVVAARESASILSEKLGDTEAKYQQLTVNHAQLKEEADQCAVYRDNYYKDLNNCNANLTQTTTVYSLRHAQYNACSTSLSEKTSQYSTCTSDLSTKSTQLDEKTTAYNNLTTKYNAVVSNSAWALCNCFSNGGATAYYRVNTENKIQCIGFTNSNPNDSEVKSVTC